MKAPTIALLGAAILGVAIAQGCGDETLAPSTDDAPAAAPHDWTDCQASAQAFVRKATLAIAGRRTSGQAEVNAYEDAIAALDAADAAPVSTPGDLPTSRRLFVSKLMAEPEYRVRWGEFFRDALHVNRRETKDQRDCYGAPSRGAFDDGALAAWVRGHAPTDAAKRRFSMEDLVSSALELDDLSVVYRANLFAMLAKPIDGANVDFLELERIRRQDFGAVFDATYLRRDVVCLGCHNSETSVTYDPDPAKNRSWPVPGLFEKALFGASNATHPPDEALTLGDDFMRAHSMLRVAGVVDLFPRGDDDDDVRPWGMTRVCGSFRPHVGSDPLKVDTYFGSVRSTDAAPDAGAHASVWDLEASLHRGVDLLSAHGLRRLPGGDLADPDEAFAYLVAMNIVEQVWTEVVGTRLTIANDIPRTAVQRDILLALTEHFVAQHFSLKTVLRDVLAHPAFNLAPPEAGCGDFAYELPNIFDPWVIADTDVQRRGNSPADGVFPVSPRPLARSLARALEWPELPDYPTRKDGAFQVAIGAFQKDAEPGFRGFDFQGRLTWEQAYGSCAARVDRDYIDRIVEEAKRRGDATLEDGVLALKDRLLGEPTIADDERGDLEKLVGAKLSSPVGAGLEQQLRDVCGVLVSTPQFLLGGLPPRDTRDVPKLTPSEVTYQGACFEVAAAVHDAGEPFDLACGASSVDARRTP